MFVAFSKRPLSDLFSLEGLFELLQLPLLLIVIAWLPTLSPYTSSTLSQRNGYRFGDALIETSLHFGFLHFLVLFNVSNLDTIFRLFYEVYDAQMRAKVLEAGIKTLGILFFFAGLMYTMIGAQYDCGTLASFTQAVAADVSAADRALLPPALLDELRAASDALGAWDPYDVNGTAPPLAGTRHVQLATRLLDALALPHGLHGVDNKLDLYGWCGRSSFPGFFDYVYYTVVTLSTVGYGDWSPTDYPTRFVGMVMMFTLMLWLPYQLTKLVDFYVQMHTSLGKLPKPWDEFVVLFGPVAPDQLCMFVSEFTILRAKAERNTFIVVLSPLPLEQYRDALKDQDEQFSSRVYVHHGDLMEQATQKMLRDSHAGGSIFAMSDKFVDLARAKAYFVFSFPGDERPLDQDRATIIRCLVLRKLLSDAAMHKVALQLNQGRDRKVALGLGAHDLA